MESNKLARDLPSSGLLPKLPREARGPKLGARNSIQVLHVGGRNPAAEAWEAESTLAGSWNQEPQSGIQPRRSDIG